MGENSPSSHRKIIMEDTDLTEIKSLVNDLVSILEAEG